MDKSVLLLIDAGREAVLGRERAREKARDDSYN